MTEAEKRTPQEIAAAIKETVRTLNEHLEEAAQWDLSVSVALQWRCSLGVPDHEIIAVTIAQKL